MRWTSHTGRCWATSATRSGTITSYRLIGPSQDYKQRFRELFGDPDADYQAALDRHYNEGPPPEWEESYVSSYAMMHPAEDWAETFAHYLHIRDALDTAAAFGFASAGATFERRVLGPSGFDTIIEMWLPLAWALNMVNRSMGKQDLYPFVLPPAVLEKMRFIHMIIDEITCFQPNSPRSAARFLARADANGPIRRRVGSLLRLLALDWFRSSTGCRRVQPGD